MMHVIFIVTWVVWFVMMIFFIKEVVLDKWIF